LLNYDRIGINKTSGNGVLERLTRRNKQEGPMKKLVISALALGAMTSVAFAEEPLKPTTGQPMELSLAQLDDVTAAGWKHKRDHKKKFNVKIEIEQENNAYQYANVYADDISGKCSKCTVVVGGSNYADQSNKVEF
jgi:hypothetical protein